MTEWKYFRAEIHIRSDEAWVEIDGNTIQGVDYAYIAHRTHTYRPAGVHISRDLLPGFIEALIRLRDINVPAPEARADEGATT